MEDYSSCLKKGTVEPYGERLSVSSSIKKLSEVICGAGEIVTIDDGKDDDRHLKAFQYV